MFSLFFNSNFKKIVNLTLFFVGPLFFQAQAQALNSFDPLSSLAQPLLSSAWSGTNISAGGVVSTGNTNAQNANAASNIFYTKKKWSLSSNDTFNFARTEDSGVTASKLFLSGQAQYSFAIKNYSFLEADYTNDRFDGYQYVLNSIIGYGRRLINQPTFSWDVQGGPGIQHAVKQAENDDDSSGLTQNNFLLNASTQLALALSKNSNMTENFSVVSTKINTRTISTTALTANLVNRFAIQVSFQAIHDSLPLSAKKNLNTITTLSLVYTLA